MAAGLFANFDFCYFFGLFVCFFDCLLCWLLSFHSKICFYYFGGFFYPDVHTFS